jgi:hypothetical protein
MVQGSTARSLTAMAIGVFASGVRDLYAALDLPHGGWPWAVRLPEVEVRR